MATESWEAKIAEKQKRKRLPAKATTTVHDLTNDLLELVLLGLDSPKWLVRAAATCKPWRRLITGAGGAFLRRFRSLHAPPAVGTFYSINRDTPCSYGRFHLWPEVDPVFVPSSESAPACTSGGSSGIQRLSLDFMPHASGGEVRRELADGRGSLLLLLTEKSRPDPRFCPCCHHVDDYMTPDLVVCEPLTRQYVAIPPPEYRVCILGAFLLDGDANETSGGTAGIDDMTSIRVLLVLYHHDFSLYTNCYDGNGYPSASVFTGGGWHHGEIDCDDGVYLPRLEEIHLAGRTGGRIYWGCDHKQVLILDEHTLEFSTMALSEHMMNWQEFRRDSFRVVGGGAGTVRIVHLTSGGNLEVFGKSHDCHGTVDDWVLEMRVQLVEATRGLPGHKEKYFAEGIKIINAEEGFVVLSPEKRKKWLFSVNLETMELKREYGKKKYAGSPAFVYTLPWPPTMRACVEIGKKRRKRRRTDQKKERL